MPKILLRVVALLVVPCLIVDPLSASGYQGTLLSRPTNLFCESDAFEQQALSPTGDVYGGKNLTLASTVRLDQASAQAGGYTRRTFLAMALSPFGFRATAVIAQGG